MLLQELKDEIQNGVQFYGYMEDGNLLAVMGIQRPNDVTLIRHAYVQPRSQRKGIGKKLLKYLISKAETPVIYVGTWKAATWAIGFYKKQGFMQVSKLEKDNLLREYWNIPERQVETSVVLKLERQPA